MPITETDSRFDDAFDAIQCPVCGSEEFSEFRFEGVFCTHCNCEVSIRPTMGDPGFIADFDAGHCWASTPDEYLLPADDAGHRTAFAKYGGGDPYYRMYLALSAEFADDVPLEVLQAYEPAWEREEDDEEEPEGTL